MQRAEAQRADLTAQVRTLEAEVAALSSLDRTERAARDRLGMVPARRTDFVTVAVESPSGPLLPRPILNPEPGKVSVNDSWWQSLYKALRLP
jgi:cell division protein FtsL